MDADLRQHPKIRKLVKKLRCSKFEAIGIICVLFGWGMRNATSEGVLIEADEEDIGEVFTGMSKKLLEEDIVGALFETGWLERNEEDQIMIHDWKEHQRPWYSYKSRKKSNTDYYQKKKGRKTEDPEESYQENMFDEDGQTNDQPKDQAEPEEKTEPEVPFDEIEPEPGKEPKEAKFTAKFERLWNEYPYKRGNKSAAFNAYKARITEGYTFKQLYDATLSYASAVRRDGTEQKYVKHGSTFFGPNKHFKEYLQPEHREAEVVVTGNPFAKYMETEQ